MPRASSSRASSTIGPRRALVGDEAGQQRRSPEPPGSHAIFIAPPAIGDHPPAPQPVERQRQDAPGQLGLHRDAPGCRRSGRAPRRRRRPGGSGRSRPARSAPWRPGSPRVLRRADAHNHEIGIRRRGRTTRRRLAGGARASRSSVAVGHERHRHHHGVSASGALGEPVDHLVRIVAERLTGKAPHHGDDPARRFGAGVRRQLLDARLQRPSVADADHRRRRWLLDRLPSGTGSSGGARALRAAVRPGAGR